MEFFTNSQPSLISDKVVSSFDKMIKDMSEQNSSVFYKFYENVIYPNLGISILILLIILFLVYRYFTFKKEKKIMETEKFNGNTNENTKNIYSSNDGRYLLKKFDDVEPINERIARPTFNPSIPISKQQSYVNYLPDEIPVRVNGELVDNVSRVNMQGNEIPYYAPQNEPNNIQYTGPFYNASQNGLSDDMYKEFVSQNQQNLNDYNNILQQKMYPQ